MSDLSKLLARLEGATGPDRGLDIDVLVALFGDPRLFVGEPRDAGYNDRLGHVTSSLDAALALVGRVSPGHAAAVGTMAFDPPGTPWGCIWAPTGSVLAQAEAPTPALALIKALLRALLADAERSEGGA